VQVNGSFTSNWSQSGFEVDVESDAPPSFTSTQSGISAQIESDSTSTTNGSLVGVTGRAFLNDGSEADEIIGGRLSNTFYNFGTAPSVDVAKGAEIGGFYAGSNADFAQRAVGLDVAAPTSGSQGATDVLIGSSGIPVGDYAVFSNTSDPSFFAGSINTSSGEDVCIEGEICLSNATTNETLDTAGGDGAVQYAYNNSLAGNTSILFINRSSGYVGVGNSSPDAQLVVSGDATVDGAFEAGVGEATGDNTSVAMGAEDFFGNAPRATGSDGAVALGKGTLASGSASTAVGTVTTAGGDAAVALNQDTNASGDASLAAGQATTASGADGALAAGYYTRASGDFGATALGTSTIASGDNGAIAVGNEVEAGGTSSVAIGLNDTRYTVAQDNTMAVMGGSVGVGTTNPSSLLTIGETGRIDFVNSTVIGSGASGSGDTKDIVIGQNANVTDSGYKNHGAVAIGLRAEADGVRYNNPGVAVGEDAGASDEGSTALGAGATAGKRGTAVGAGSNAPSRDIAIGRNADANDGIAIGNGVTSNGWSVTIGGSHNNDYSVAVGDDSFAGGSAAALGQKANASQWGVAVGGSANAGYPSGVAVGRQADAGDRGIAIGKEASSGSSGIALGQKSTSNDNEFVVGSDDRNINEARIGVQSSGAPLVYADTTGVGLGTTNPSADLNVNGTVNVSMASGEEALYVDQSSGNIGVGTSNTSEQLTIAGNNSILFTSTSPQNKTTEIFADDSDSLNVRYQGGAGKSFNIKSGTTTVANFRAESTGHRIYGDLQLQDGLTVDDEQLVVDESSDQVGINTTSPSADLDVVGDAEVSENLDVGGNVSVGDSITDSNGDRRIEMKNDKVVINLG
jgi:hypothetical protein